MLSVLMPPGAWPWVVVAWLVIPVALLATESVVSPLLEHGLRFISSGEWVLPPYYFLKLLGLLALLACGPGLLLTRLQVVYLAGFARLYPRPDSLHSDYQPEFTASMASMLSWKNYRLLRVVLPPGLMLVVTMGLGWLEMGLFNAMAGGWAPLQPLLYAMGLFVFLVFGLLTTILGFNSLWALFSSVYGACTAVTEPHLPNDIIFARGNRLAWTSPLAGVLAGYYVVFYTVAGFFLVWLLASYNIDTLFNLQPETPERWLSVLSLEAVVAVLYVGLLALKFASYHKALQFYYDKLPRQVRAQFQVPL